MTRRTRRAVQLAFLTLTLAAVFLLGANAELWCPFGGVEALFEYYAEGTMLCSLGISNFYILGVLLVMTLLLRRAFCSHVCPIGTTSEWLGNAGAAMKLPRLRVGGRADWVLGLGKYAVLGLILWFTLSHRELIFRTACPAYALISRHGTDITAWAYVVAGAIALASLMIVLPFCRWFCPLAAVLSPLSRLGLARVKREAASCSDCRRCAVACPMAIPVDRLPEVTAARCTSCLNCVEACPKSGEGVLHWGPPRWMGGAWSQAVLLGVLFACLGVAAAAAYLAPLPSYVKSHGAPPAETAAVELRVSELNCRGRANLLFWFLERDDLFQLGSSVPGETGYFKLEAWPGPGWARVRVTFDPAAADASAVRSAITEPYFNLRGDAIETRWMTSPFGVEGYDPLAPPDTVPPLPSS
ncbi:MAG: 4Fe-4S binding protein [Patescibacteria group bacterium]|nr:4Fe-4S binding protein [Patescibacteria group bacterium]